MQIGVVFPQTEIGAAVAHVRRYGEPVRSSASPTSSPTTTCSAPTPRPTAVATGPYDVHTTFHEPFVLFGYLAALHRAGARHRRDHPPPAPDRARRQAGRRGRPAHRRAVPAGRRPRLERGRVRGARQGLHQPRPADGRADPAAAPAVDRAGRSPTTATFDTRHGRRHHPAARAAADPDLDRRPVDAGLPPRRAARRRLVPAGAAGAEARRGPGGRRARPPTRRAATRRRSGWRAG